MEKEILAIIVPCYNEEAILKLTYNKLLNVINELIKKELISDKSFIYFVDDGSKDTSWEIIQNVSKSGNAKGLKLSRNFGHQAAIFAGLSEATADIFITIDADLQDDIKIIEDMVLKYKEGYEIVYGVRNRRDTDNFIKKLTALGYYKISKLLGVCGIPNHGDFRMISKKIVNIIRKSKESNLYLRGLIPSLGFKSTILYYSRLSRIGGEPKYTYLKLLNLAIDGITSFSEKPLRIIFLLGLLISIFSLLGIVTIVLNHIIFGIFHKLLFIVFLIWLTCGINLLCLGIVAEYIGKLFNQTKERPRYIIEERL